VAEIRILILQQGTRHNADEWTEKDDSPLNLDKWKENSSRWPERLLANNRGQMEVFLCLDKELLAEGCDPPFLHRVIEQAHKSMWGAKVYVVVDKEWQPEDRDPEQPDPFLWAEGLLENKVSDILEWSLKDDSNYSEAALRSRKRAEMLFNYPPSKPWKCLFRTRLSLSTEEEYLLSPYLVDSLDELDNENCLVVLRHMSDEGYLEYIEEKLQQATNYEMMVGAIDRVVRTLPSDLVKLCRKKGCGPVRFHGVAELYYFLQRLNNPRLENIRLSNLRLIDETKVTPVRVAANPRFRSHSPQLLITYAYLPEQPDSCFAAANDTWQLIGDLPSNVRVKIYPAIKSAKLADILKDMGHVLAWIHMGHGDEENGLQQAEDKLFKSAEDWLKSFADYKSSLALAMFSSRRSAAVAQRFAEAGAGVAIGFTDELHQKVCVELTKRVVEAAVEANGERSAILTAFSVGREILEVKDPNASPVAFWANH
jgi:hypothetical protein